MRNNPDFLSSKTIHWCTPKKLYDCFMNHGYYDPCPLYSKEDNLKQEFFGCKLFINPPFKDLSKWVNKAIEWASYDCDVWLLMPARTDTKYFNRLANFRCFVFFFIGRLHFNDSSKAAPFPTMLVRLNNDNVDNLFFHGTLDDFVNYFFD